MARKRRPSGDFTEFAVDRATLMQFFRPPVSESTFYKLQRDGYIVPVDGVSGRYRLNASLLAMGLNPVNRLPKSEDAAAERERVVRLALWLLAPDLTESPSWLLSRDPSPEETERAIFLTLYLLPKIDTLDTEAERKAFVQGVLDAEYLIGKGSNGQASG